MAKKPKIDITAPATDIFEEALERGEPPPIEHGTSTVIPARPFMQVRHHATRLRLDMNGMETLHAMSEGSPGALNVCLLILKEAVNIDPDSLFPLASILSLDQFGIYAERIWLLYKDVCGQNLSHFLGMVRAVQLGIIPLEVLDHAIDNRAEGLDVHGTMKLVLDRLPSFRISF